MFRVVFNAGHGKIIDAHAVGQTNALIFQRHVVVVVVAAEHGLAAQLPCPVEEIAGKVRAADLVDHLLPIHAEEIRNLSAARLIELIGCAILLQRNIRAFV